MRDSRYNIFLAKIFLANIFSPNPESNSNARYSSINIFVKCGGYFYHLLMHERSFIVINDVYKIHDLMRSKFLG